MLAAEGARVAVAGRRKEPLEQVVAEIQRDKGTAASKTSDLTKPHDARELGAWAVKTFGGVDILVNNAGQSSPRAQHPVGRAGRVGRRARREYHGRVRAHADAPAVDARARRGHRDHRGLDGGAAAPAGSPASPTAWPRPARAR